MIHNVIEWCTERFATMVFNVMVKCYVIWIGSKEFEDERRWFACSRVVIRLITIFFLKSLTTN